MAEYKPYEIIVETETEESGRKTFVRYYYQLLQNFYFAYFKNFQFSKYK